MLMFSSRPERLAAPGLVLPTLAVAGAGRVGFALAQALAARGYPVTAVYSRTRASAATLAESVGASVADSPADVARHADLIVLTVPDSAIAQVCQQLTADSDPPIDWRGKAVAHTSGVTPVAALASARARGAQTGGLHPILPITRAGTFPAGGAFGIEASIEPLRGWLGGLVEALDGTALWLRPGLDRARYHAAAALLSNSLVTLFAESAALLDGVVADQGAAYQALLSLAEATLANLKRAEPGKLAAALTGPIARGDAKTIQVHLAALDKLDPELAQLYRLLGRRTLRLAESGGAYDPEQRARLLEALLDHADDDFRYSKDEARRPENPDGDGL